MIYWLRFKLFCIQLFCRHVPVAMIRQTKDVLCVRIVCQKCLHEKFHMDFEGQGVRSKAPTETVH